MSINFKNASFRDFENIPDMNILERSNKFHDFLMYMEENGHLNYRFENISGCGPEMNVITQADNLHHNYVSFVSNDYLGFTQHPKVKDAVINAIQTFGTGAGASPLIGGYFSFHRQLEEKIANFFGRNKESSVIYTTGYTANSASLQSLLLKEDIAIIDMAVHASVLEGCVYTNKKTFLHNDLESLERILKDSQNKYRTKMVIIDGVYSQDGDIAPLDKIWELTQHYKAFLMVDDAHGIGVLGKTGRGVLELYGMLDKVDLITGTFSKSFANIGGYVIGNSKIMSFLKFQSRQHIFSATSTPATAGIVKAIELIDEEPFWQKQLATNIAYFKKGLGTLGMDTGTTQSAIIPIKIGDPHKTSDVGRLLLKAGIYTNPILYPAVAKKNARIRMSLMATHTKENLDKALNVLEDIDKVLSISKREYA